ncbi:Bromodomain-containing protein [Polychaeton citri CBS 116435]|uniref:Bromodomain-containing protein n=1 Tax=Polychaeton citri CBS 116435 TaxID=1314669 RepID=A0A9P4Q3I7_9PEZI|nr:Bromodomain-containing protein [Polychaeton citri CBS 116435]
MDGSRKRKASNATPAHNEGGTKKLKLLHTNVQSLGNQLVTNLRGAVDKTKRPIANAFLELPSRDELPDYYEVTKLPVAISTIQEKLDNNAYPTMTTLESDLKRMVQNAKDYNVSGSPVYEDAERIRKLVYNYMKANNPAYRDPNYSSFATPIPDRIATPATNGAHTNGDKDKTPSRPPSERPIRRSTAAPSEPVDRKTSVAPSHASGTDFTDYAGLSFADAQQKIVTDFIKYVDNEGLRIYTPFETLPSRQLEDYYAVIKNPVSLRSVLKRAKGQHGRNPVTGISDFKTWDAFESEIGLIWRNAKTYNEDGSEMFELATRFEEHFKEVLAQVKEQVSEPSSGTRIKLAGPKPPVTLNLSQSRPSPSPGVGIDNAALQRQKQMVAAGVNGKQNVSSATPANGMVRTSSQASNASTPRPLTAASPTPAAGIKKEKTSTQSPALASATLATVAPSATVPATVAATPATKTMGTATAATAVAPTITAAAAAPTASTNGVMPPPTVARPPSASPFAPPPVPRSVSQQFTVPAPLPPTPIRPYPQSQALLPNVTIATHPQLKIPAPYRLNVPPHASLSQQSRTITLPNTHYFLQVMPQVSKQLALGRPYKMFVTINGMRLSQRDTQFDVGTGCRTHVYEGSLAQGVNRIEVEVATAKEKEGGKGLDVEKVTVFANLMRA